MKFLKSKRSIIIAVTGLILLCCVGLIVVSLFTDTEERANIDDVTNATPTIEVSESSGEINVDSLETLESSATPLPIDTQDPTNTPEPTSTPLPTNTPLPTSTNTPIPTPTNTPEPIILSGAGDSIVSVDKSSGPMLVRISGNAGSRFFSVSNYDSEGNQINLLVNTTEPYEGTRPIDFRIDENTVEFEISATGDWLIEVLPLSNIEQVSIPGTASGNGDYVFALDGDSPSRATITGNNASRYFGVFAYGSNIDLLVNTTDPYEGTVRLENDTIIIEIQASDGWEIQIE